MNTIQMRILLFCIFYCALSTGSAAETAGRDGADVEKLRSEIQAVRPGSFFQIGLHKALCKRVYDTRNVELLALSWEKPSMQADLKELILEDHDTEFRNQFVLVLLRASTAAWHEEFRDYYPRLAEDEGYRAPRGILYTICSAFLKHHLPAETLEKYPIDKRENRLILASLFEKALKNEAVGIPSPASSLPSTGPSASNNTKSAPAWPWIVGVVALVATFMVVWVRRT